MTITFEEDSTLNLPVQNMRKNEREIPAKERDFKYTQALKPGLDWDGESVEVTSEVYTEPVRDWDTLIEELGYDPELHEIIEPVKISAWDVPSDGGVKKLYSYKVGIRSKQKSQYRDEDFKELVSIIKKHRPQKKDEIKAGNEGTMFIFLSDWQAGKADGDGVEGFVKRLMNRIDLIADRINELKKLGRVINKIVVVGLGDMVEGCEGHYASQTFTVQLNRRQQVRLVRRLIVTLLIKIAKLADEIEVYAVPGNHGENRKDGRAYTTRGDNDDVSVFEMAAEIFAANPQAYGHINFFIPEDELYAIAKAPGGRNVGFVHGHVTAGGADPQKKVRDWWKDQAFCKNDIGFVDILVTGHYHHLSIIEYDDQTIHIQAPSEDGGSVWYKDLKGVDSRPGTLTFLVDSSGKPYRDMEVL